MKNCLKCEVELTNENWFPSLKVKNAKICKKCHLEYGKIWRRNNKDKVKAISRRSYLKNPSYIHNWVTQNRIDVRKEMIKSYGGKCVKCGRNDSEVLEIDHIDNTGGKDRKRGIYGWKLYRRLKREGYPKDNYQLLCRNCNWKKELERRRHI